MPTIEDWELHKVGFILILCALLERMRTARDRAFELGANFLVARLTPYWERFESMYETATSDGEQPIFG